MKKVAIVVLVLFIGFYLLREPTELASFAETVVVGGWGLLTTLFQAVMDFLSALLG